MSGLTRFDYGALSEPEQRAFERHAEAIEAIGKTVSTGLLDLGREFLGARERWSNRGNGKFGLWVETRTRFSRRYAEQAIAAFETFGKDCAHVCANFDESSMRLLSAPSCPTQARSEAVRLAGSGKLVTHKLAKDLVEKHSPKPAGLPAGYSPHGTGNKAPARSKSEAKRVAVLTAPVDPPTDPQPWPGGDEPSTAVDGPEFEAPVVVETTAKTVQDIDPDLVFRDGLLSLFAAWKSLSGSLVKPVVTKCIADALEMLSTGEPIE